MRNNERGADFHKDHRETIELVRRDEEHILRKVPRMYIIYQRKGERTTENKMERRMPTRHEMYWTEMERATWSRKIIRHISDPV